MIDAVIVCIPQTPPSVNEMFIQPYGRRRRCLTPKYRQFKEIVAQVVNGAKVPQEWKFYKVDFIITHKARYVFDVDNFNKATFDALTACGFWPDDSYVADLRNRCTVPNKDAPQTTLIIRQAAAKFLTTAEFNDLVFRSPFVIGDNRQ